MIVPISIDHEDDNLPNIEKALEIVDLYSVIYSKEGLKFTYKICVGEYNILVIFEIFKLSV